METNIYLVRHAHSVYSSDELNRPLSQKGYTDAKRITDAVLKEKIDYVIASPYKRAIETVQGIADMSNKEIIIDDRFKERILAKGSIENFDEVIMQAWMDFGFSLHGGESGNTAQMRGIKAINDVLNKYKGKNIAIGTHGNIMVLIMNYYDKKYDYLFWKNLEMPDVYKLSFEDAKLISVNKIWNKVYK